MAFLGALLFGLGAGSCCVGQKCRLLGVCIVAVSGWLAQFGGGLRRVVQGSFCFVCDQAALGWCFLVADVINILFAISLARAGAAGAVRRPRGANMWCQCGCA